MHPNAQGPPGRKKREAGAATTNHDTDSQRSVTTQAPDQDHLSRPVRQSRQFPAVAQLPDVDVLLVDSLLWSRADDAEEVLRLVHDDDLASPHLAAVLAVIREMLIGGQQVSPQLVLDRLVQAGACSTPIRTAILDATTSGGCPEAVREYAAATVAASLRRHVESGGLAMSSTDDYTEAELPVLVAAIAATIEAVAARLAALRGEVTP
jgi:hypothetical protein